MQDIILRRRSCRKYLEKDIPDETIRKVLLSAISAPGGRPSVPGSQGFRAIVVRDTGVKEKLALHYDDRQFVKTAPVVIACLADTTTDPKYKEHEISCALAIQNLLLSAESHNLGACFITCFLKHKDRAEQKQILRTALGLTESLALVALVTLGFKDPTEKIEPKIMPSYDDIVSVL